jgi:hypothetical protein
LEKSSVLKKKSHVSNQGSKETKNGFRFYPRVVNNSTVGFSAQEIALLEKGLKYNLHQKPKFWIERLALEAETAMLTLKNKNSSGTR